MEGSVQNLGYNLNCYSGRYNPNLYGSGVTNPYLNFAGKEPSFDSVYDPFLSDIKFDCIRFSGPNPEIEEKYDDVLDKQGIVGKVWDFTKNCFGSKMGSKAVTKKLELYKKGLISEDEIIDTVNKFAKGQQKALDFVADWGSTIVGAGAFALALPIVGSCVPIALGCAALSGALFKAGTKKFDAYSAGRNYKSGPYDLATGAINGLLSPIVNGVGNATVKAVAGKIGLKNVTKAAAKFSCNGFCDLIQSLALYPKQALEGNAVKRLAAWGTGKAFRGITKFGGAFALRQYVFAVFSQDAISKKILRNTPFVKVFGQQEILDKLNKNQPEIDFSNDMYAACMMSPEQLEKINKAGGVALSA